MSEPDKTAVAEVTAADCGTGQVEGTGDKDVVKSEKEENGTKEIEENEEGKHAKKEEDVKSEDTADKEGMVEEEGKIGKEVEREEPIKDKVEEEENKENKSGEPLMEIDEEATEKGESEGKGKEDEEKTDGSESEEKGKEGEEKTDESESEEKGKEGEEKTDEIEDKEVTKKRSRDKKLSSHEFEEKEEKIMKKRGRKAKEVLTTPVSSSVDRPIRERKTVERLVETLRKEPVNKAFLIEKGRGTPLKDIPNVAYKLSKKRPSDIRSLHMLLFGRKGKATHYKNHISQFSGFVWHENEEKQRTKVKEKLDKCVKDKLLDFCDVFDIPVSKATMRKEDLVEKLLDFMVAPHPTSDVILAEKEQSLKSKKRKSRGRTSHTVATPRMYSRKKRTKGEDAEKSEKRENGTEDDDGDDKENENDGNNDDDVPDEDEAIKHSEDEEANESEHDDIEEEYSHKGRQDPKKSKRRGSSAKASKIVVTPKKVLSSPTAKSPIRNSSKLKTKEDKNKNEKALLKKKKEDVTPRKKNLSPRPEGKEKKTTGKRAGREKAKSDKAAADTGPTEDDLRKTICEILKEVDFNTATFTDILKKLASHYKMDLTTRKASIKLMIQDELTKLADEAEDEDDENEDESDKDGEPEPAGKKVKA